MTTYTLNLNFNQSDLEAISGEKVVIARAFSDSESNVAWVCFQPLLDNQVSWDDNYGVYFAVAQSSGSLQKNGSLPVGIISGASYRLDPNGIFSGPDSGQGSPAPGSYRVSNGMPSADHPFLFFGLTQGVNVNNVEIAPSPTNVTRIPANQFGTFTPLDAVYVWVQSNVAPGEIVELPPAADGFKSSVSGAVSSLSTMIQFSTPSTVAYKYSARFGGFVPDVT